MSIVKRIGVVVLVLAVSALALIGLLQMTRGTPIELVLAKDAGAGPPPPADSLFLRTMELYTGTHVEPGNRVDVLLNGDGTHPPLWRDLASAQRTITVQMYYSQPGAIADSMAAVLEERARAKVRVLVLLDAFGSQNLTQEWRDGLTGAGVELREFRPKRWYELHKLQNRSHARVVVVDGRVGYTGGFGLADYWQGDGRSAEEWRETNVRFEGPSVAQLQAAFAAGWAEASGELLTGDAFFPPHSFADAGGVQAGLMHTLPTVGSTPAERFLFLSIAGARQRLYIANSYFVPDDDLRGVLARAAQRGVDVRILTAGPKTDIKSTYYAGRARYEELLKAGVRVYEYQPTMMHAKSMVVDGLWSTIGSMNFDNRSIALNNESNLVTLDPKVGATLDSVFLEDLRFSKEITLAEFGQRPWYHRVLERGSTLLSRIL
jgi:cardiolipin synthase A/B